MARRVGRRAGTKAPGNSICIVTEGRVTEREYLEALRTRLGISKNLGQRLLRKHGWRGSLQYVERLRRLLVTVDDRLLDASAMENRLDLNVVLNSCKDACLRQISSASLAGYADRTSEQLPRLSRLTDFGIESVTNTLDKVVARPEDDDIFDGAICTRDALAFSTHRDAMQKRSSVCWAR